jgi:tetratricopeptide (TPR) repeat protein
VTGTAALRGAVAGLLSFATAEEQVLLAAHGGDDDRGSPDRWAAVPLIAHNNHFKRQQAERLEAVRTGAAPAAYGEIDHACAEVYQAYRAQPPATVLADCRRVSAELVDGTWALPEEDLLDPARHQWLNGRMLWLQIIVRGFWHPTGHLGDYYLVRGQTERAVALQAHALATARYLRAPAAATGMAGYSLACALAKAGQPDEAIRTLAEAIGANPDLRANASRDRDLAGLRDSGQLAGLLTAAR